MKIRLIFGLITAAIMTGNSFAGVKEEQFWVWFSEHNEMLYSIDIEGTNEFDELSARLFAVNEDLTFELSPILQDGKREFVISAGGIKSAFPAVEALVKAAPKFEKWKVIKFRPRRSPINDISYSGVDVKAKDVFYKLFKDNGDKVGIIIFIKGYSENGKDIYGNIGYLFLDEALGEHDVETKLSFIEFHPHSSKKFKGSIPIDELPQHIDSYFDKE